MEQRSDNELVELIKHGNRLAFEAIYWRYQSRVIAIAYGVVRNKHDAADVAQETFIKVYNNINKFDAISSFYTWLYRVTVNLAIDSLRRKKREKQSELNTDYQENYSEISPLRPSTLGVNPAKVYERKELLEQLSKAFDALSEKHRTIVTLREIEGLSYQEISEVLEISKGTVMSRLFHARAKLQDILREYLAAEEELPDKDIDNKNTDENE